MVACDYTVLRISDHDRTMEPFGRVTPRGLPGPKAMGGPSQAVAKVQTERLTSREVRERACDPEVAGIALHMPTKLVRPLAADMAAAGDVWGIGAVGAAESGLTGAGVTVAVLDTGIDVEHTAFQGLEIVEKDFSGSGNGDRQGHGTHCAGTILGRSVGGTRIGVAPGVTKLLAGKVLGDDGGGSSDMIFQGIQWAVNQGAQVISMSPGFDFPGMVQDLVKREGWREDLATSLALEAYRGNLGVFDALMAWVEASTAFGSGAILVAAAGNESHREIKPDYEIAAGLPAAARGVVSVGAVGKGANGRFTLADFSNTFPQLCGPGVNIVSAKAGSHDGLVAFSGTSMATPHVAGVCALWWQAVRESAVPLTKATVLARLLASARTAGLDGIDVADRGQGMVRAPQMAA